MDSGHYGISGLSEDGSVSCPPSPTGSIGVVSNIQDEEFSNQCMHISDTSDVSHQNMTTSHTPASSKFEKDTPISQYHMSQYTGIDSGYTGSGVPTSHVETTSSSSRPRYLARQSQTRVQFVGAVKEMVFDIPLNPLQTDIAISKCVPTCTESHLTVL